MGWGPTFNVPRISNVTSAIGQTVSRVVEDVEEVNITGNASTFGAGVVSNVSSSTGNAVKGIKQAGGVAAQTIVKNVGRAVTTGENLIQGGKDFAETTGRTVGKPAVSVVGRANVLSRGTIGGTIGMANPMSVALGTIQGITQQTQENVQEVGQSAIDTVNNTIGRVQDNTRDYLTNAVLENVPGYGFMKTIGDWFNSVVDSIYSLFSSIRTM